MIEKLIVKYIKDWANVFDELETQIGELQWKSMKEKNVKIVKKG